MHHRRSERFWATKLHWPMKIKKTKCNNTPADTDVFKASSGRLKKVTRSYDQTRRRHDVWKRRRTYNVFKTSDLRRLEDVEFTTSWRRLIYDVFRTSGLRRLEDIWFTSSWRCPIWDILKTSDLQRLQKVWFRMSWRRSIYLVFKMLNLQRHEYVWFTTSWRRLIYGVLKTSVKQRLCSNIVATSIERRRNDFFLFVLSEIFRKF